MTDTTHLDIGRRRRPDKSRITQRRNARIHRRAQALALAYLQVNHRTAYLGIYQMARESVIGDDIAYLEERDPQ